MEPEKTIGVIFFDHQEQAIHHLDKLIELSSKVNQLNIVIREECKAINTKLEGVGTVYCGSAWHQAHEQRVKEQWYPAERIFT